MKKQNQIQSQSNNENAIAINAGREVGESIISILIMGMLVIFAVLLIALPKKDFSENENRYLAKMPELSWKAIVDGSYMENLDSYLTDHFPMRDVWVTLQSETEIACGKRMVNGILIAEDGYLIGNYDTPQSTERIIGSFQKFAQSIYSKNPEINAKLMLVPTAITIYEDKLPIGAMPASQMDTIAQIRENVDLPFVDVYPVLMEHRNEEIFYHTDHHWTTLGAYYAYQVYCQENGFTAIPLTDFASQIVTNQFYGTYASKVNLWQQKGDNITIYSNPADSLSVYYKDEDIMTDTLYNLAYVNAKDKYSLFLDNLHTLIEITNDNAETDRVLLLVKDSYANSMVPFLVQNYQKIYVVDTRYYKNGSSSLLDEHPEITDVLVLYNLSTMDTDTGIRGIF